MLMCRSGMHIVCTWLPSNDVKVQFFSIGSAEFYGSCESKPNTSCHGLHVAADFACCYVCIMRQSYFAKAKSSCQRKSHVIDAAKQDIEHIT